MKQFRRMVQRCRWLVILVLATTTFQSVQGDLYAEVWKAEQADRERLEEMAERLGLPVERLEREQPGLLAALRGGDEEEAVRQAGRARLEAQQRHHAAVVEGNRFRDRALEVKEGYRLTRIEAELAALDAFALRDMPRESRRALASNLRASLREALELPAPDALPGPARARHNRMQARLNALAGTATADPRPPRR